MSAADLQAALAAEHAAVWIYGVIGGQTSQAESPGLYELVVQAYRAHRGNRDQLVTAIARAGEEPAAAAVGYELGDVSTESRARAVALGVEQRCSAVFAAAVAATSGPHRRFAIAALTGSALRELGFGGSPATWPGLDG